MSEEEINLKGKRPHLALGKPVLTGYLPGHPKYVASSPLLIDRFVLDDAAFVAWCNEAFGSADRESALARITDIDPLNETVIVDNVEHRIPDKCYRKIFAEP